MRELEAEIRLYRRARAVERRAAAFHTIAMYSSLALIAAIVFGAISARPF